MTDEELTAEQASANAVVKAQESREAVEQARLLQNRQIVEETAARTKDALLEGLKEVFGDSDDPQQMKVLVRRIPIVCQDILKIHEDISSIKDNLTWGVRIVIGAVILGVIGLLLK